ncbi:hypothetical protein [Robertkochia sediminum]|uniref:hypothetical protein n=1 Tax=Robertkochia sediminum TaxID=2785326 RepID=UPI0019337333|nr:hypothetical protein [Robertkochia sediminum]MBL7472252.1 hypothetical protein [Robertkochia sediminum]
MRAIIIAVVFMLGARGVCDAQSVALDRLGKDKWLKYSGGIQALGVFYNGMAPRDPFGYMVRGDLNFTVAGIYHLPFSFTYSDQQLRFPSPIRLNRFSFHPSYKGFQLHLGDASMSFSPYTLDGHQFTGVGAEYRGSGPWSAAVMYGRLLKHVPYLPDRSEITPVHERRGYGVNLGYTSRAWDLKAMVFTANDRPDPGASELSKYPFPERNLVLGWQGRLSVFQKGRLVVDHAHSVIGLDEEGMKRYFPENFGDSISHLSRERYNALKVSLDYPAFAGNLAVVYERVDPGYRTFGAYYFNADLENIAVAASQSLFKGKVALQLRSGVQRDNLDRTKNSEFRRMVNSVDLAYTPDRKLSVHTHYSNFLTHTNSRDQFDQINRVSTLDILDTLSYRQLSQQASINMRYQIVNAPGNNRAWSLLLNFQENSNRTDASQGEQHQDQFYQGALNYDVRLRESGWQYGANLNASLSNGGQEDRLTWGPGVHAGRAFLNKKLNTRMTMGYNRTDGGEGYDGSVFNCRVNASWNLYSFHQLGASGLYQYRDLERAPGGDLTIQLTYHYRFDNFRISLQDREDISGIKTNPPVKVRFRYRDVMYSGTIAEVNRQLALVSRDPKFRVLPEDAKQELVRLRKAYLKQEKRSGYKFHALHYLAVLYHYGDAIERYYHEADMAIRKIIFDMRHTDHELERRYVQSKKLWTNTGTEKDEAKLRRLEEAYRECSRRLKGHRWLETQLRSYEGLSFDGAVNPAIRTYLESHLQEHLTALEQGTTPEALRLAIETGLIDHFYRRSLQHTSNTAVDLRYYHLKSK